LRSILHTNYILMRILLVILILFLGSTGLNAQSAGWASTGTEAISPAGNELNGALDVRVFPNPVYDKRVNIELSDQSIQELRITNIAGTVIFSRRFQVPVTKHQIVLENVPSGVYLLRVISDGNQSRTTKLMIRNQ
jgi:hypothetical protein